MRQAIKPQPKPDGVLRIVRETALPWSKWFAREVAGLGLGKETGLVRFADLVEKSAAEIGDAKGLAFPMSNSFRETLVDFHRLMRIDSMHPIFYALGAGWNAAPVKPEKVPAEDLARCEEIQREPYVVEPFVPVVMPEKETKVEKRKEKVLF